MIGEVVRLVRERQPLVHCLSAAVSLGIVADGLLAAGAKPMMTETIGEAPVLVGVADALLINLGTLSTDGAAAMVPTVGAARVPWVLDPAAIGPTTLRRNLARDLAARGPAVIRANASEVLVLADDAVGGRGPDSTASPGEALDAARRLALRTGAVVAISGASDLVVPPDGPVAVLSNGSALLPLVVGTGCLLGALTAACAVVATPTEAAIAAAAWLGVAAEIAEPGCGGPASFKARLIDALYAVSPTTVEQTARLTWI